MIRMAKKNPRRCGWENLLKASLYELYGTDVKLVFLYLLNENTVSNRCNLTGKVFFFGIQMIDYKYVSGERGKLA